MKFLSRIIFSVFSLLLLVSPGIISADTPSLGSTNTSQGSNGTLNFGGFSNATEPQKQTGGFIGGQALNVTAPSPSDPCQLKVDSQVDSIKSTINSTKVISLAYNNETFKSDTQGFSANLYLIMGTWSWDSNCNTTLNYLDVFYSISTAKGFDHYLVFTEDPASTRIIKTSTQYPHASYTTNNWSGYEFKADGNTPPTTPVYEAYASWVVPAARNPLSIYTQCTISLPCDLSIWTGLVSNPGGDYVNGSMGGAIVQAGTESFNQGTPTPSIYDAWMEFYPQPMIGCGITVNFNDQIVATVTNEGKSNNNPSNNLYDLTLKDLSDNQACTPIYGHAFQMGTPYYAEFINETPPFLSGNAILPEFASDTMFGSMYDPTNEFHSISNSYNNVWYKSYTILNFPWGSVYYTGASTGSFSEFSSPFCESYNPLAWPLESCTLQSNTSTQGGNVILQNNVVLTVPTGITLTVGLNTANILTDHGNRLVVQYGGTIK